MPFAYTKGLFISHLHLHTSLYCSSNEAVIMVHNDTPSAWRGVYDFPVQNTTFRAIPISDYTISVTLTTIQSTLIMLKQ